MRGNAIITDIISGKVKGSFKKNKKGSMLAVLFLQTVIYKYTDRMTI